MAENGMQNIEQEAEEVNLLIDVRNGCFSEQNTISFLDPIRQCPPFAVFIAVCTIVVLAMTANFLTIQPAALSRTESLCFAIS